MRSSIGLFSLLVAFSFPTVTAQVGPPTESQREELRKRADELRAKNAREREEIQKGFASSSPATAPQGATPEVGQVCKATIAALMGRPPEIVTVAREEAGVVYLAYQRPSDKTLWRNRCKVVGSTVLWASEPGRWRDNPQDERVTFQFKAPDQLIIRQRFSDGSNSEKAFSLKDL